MSKVRYVLLLVVVAAIGVVLSFTLPGASAPPTPKPAKVSQPLPVQTVYDTFPAPATPTTVTPTPPVVAPKPSVAPVTPVTSPTAPTAPAVSQAPVAPPTTVSTPTWAGYEVGNGTTDAYRTVATIFTVPTITSCGATESSFGSIWSGLGGQGGNVEQEGVELQCYDGNVSYYGWYEMFPSPLVQIPSFKVSPGDSVIATTQWLGDGTYRLSLNNVTGSGDDWTQVVAPAGGIAPNNASAECIAENPSYNTASYTFAHFTPVTFTGCSVDGAPISALSPTRYNVVDNGATVLVTSCFFDPNHDDFTVTRQ
jgi:hypothetical protein